MAALSDPDVAQRLLSAIEAAASQKIDQVRPSYRYGTVTEINIEESYVYVLFPENTSAVKVNTDSIIPSAVGQTVRVDGLAGDRYVSAVMGVTLIATPPSGDLGQPILSVDAAVEGFIARWTDVGSQQYELQVDSDELFTNPIGYFTSGLIAQVGFLTAGTTYYVRVRSTTNDKTSSGAWSDVQSVIPTAFLSLGLDGSPPDDSPTPSVTAGLGSVYATWAPATGTVDVVIYEVHASLESGFTPNPDTLIYETSSTFAVITELANGTSLRTLYGTNVFVRTVAKDNDGAAVASAQGFAAPERVETGDVGTIASAQVGGDGVAPGASPSINFRAGIGFFYVWWNHVTNADAVTYEVHISTQNGFGPTGNTLVGETPSNYTFIREQSTDDGGGALVQTIAYYIRVVAKDNDGSAVPGPQAGPAITAQASTADIEALAITNALIADLAVDQAKIVDASITTAKIADLAVSQAKIADLAVDTAQINDLAVASGKIQDLAVTSAKISDLAVTEAKIASAAITTAKIDTLAVSTAAIQDGAITNAKIGSLAVDTAEIANGAITNAKIDDLAVDTANIANLAVDTAQIANLSVAGNKIDSGAISNPKMGDNSVDTPEIVNDAVDGPQINDGAINPTHIDWLDANLITTGTLEADFISSGTLDGVLIRGNNIETIAPGTGTRYVRMSAGTPGTGHASHALEFGSNSDSGLVNTRLYYTGGEFWIDAFVGGATGLRMQADFCSIDTTIGNFQVVTQATLIQDIWDSTTPTAANVNVTTNGSLRKFVAGDVNQKVNMQSVSTTDAYAVLNADPVVFDTVTSLPKGKRGFDIDIHKKVVGIAAQQIDHMVDTEGGLVLTRDNQVQYHAFTCAHNVILADMAKRLDALEAK